MRLAIDANVLVSEALRERGRQLLQNPELDLFIATETRNEAEYEIRRRIDIMTTRGFTTAEQAPQSLDFALGVISTALTTVASARYAPYLEEARKRIPRDPGDAPTVALALALACGIWTSDYDFFGCGVATWTTETIRIQLSGTPGA
jgi:predicted nucleic acid-binding protein